MTGTKMLAEIHEQPEALRELCRRAAHEWRLPPALFRRISSAVIVGSGSSFNAGLAMRLYLETMAALPARVESASEAFRHRVPGRPLAIGLSHSGRSADVRAALKRANRQGCRTLGLTNIEGSPLTREVDAALVTGAGVERAIPSTKGFTGLVAASLLVAAHRSGSLASSVRAVRRAARVIDGLEASEAVVEQVALAKAVVLLGEGLMYPVARDAALKLVEVAYLPALAYPPDEFRHGPIALADASVAIVALARLPRAVADAVRASGARVVELPRAPNVPRPVRALVRAAQLQRLSHDVGLVLGRDVDSPRNLSKVVR